MTDLRKTSGCVICIDLKSFYASVECADRGLDPFTTNLVVADPDRSANTICLAITPAMKAAGVRNRPVPVLHRAAPRPQAVRPPAPRLVRSGIYPSLVRRSPPERSFSLRTSRRGAAHGFFKKFQ